MIVECNVFSLIDTKWWIARFIPLQLSGIVKLDPSLCMGMGLKPKDLQAQDKVKTLRRAVEIMFSLIWLIFCLALVYHSVCVRKFLYLSFFCHSVLAKLVHLFKRFNGWLFDLKQFSFIDDTKFRIKKLWCLLLLSCFCFRASGTTGRAIFAHLIKLHYHSSNPNCNVNTTVLTHKNCSTFTKMKDVPKLRLWCIMLLWVIKD